MKFGVLAGNEHINSRIYDMFESIDSEDVPKFVSKFRSEQDEQRFHTYRELVVGSHLRTNGLGARYEQSVLGKTPDWILYSSSGEIKELLDVVSLHQRRETETDMFRTFSPGESWTGWVTIPPNHIYAKVEHKANLYAGLARKLSKPYTIFLFGEFVACVEPEEIEHVLYGLHDGLFSSHPMLAAVVYFTESTGMYNYSYFTNSTATYSSPVVQALSGGGTA